MYLLCGFIVMFFSPHSSYSAIVLIGGVNSANEYVTQVEVVDDNSNCSENIQDIPEGRSYAGAVETEDEKIVFCGGFSGGRRQNECWTWDEQGWVETGGLVEKRNLFTMTAVMEKVVVMGGSNDENGDLSSVEIYVDGTWRIEPSLELTSTRYGHCAVEHSNQIIVIGGVISRHTTDLVEILDMNQEETGWSNLPSMSVKRGYTACAVVEYSGVTGVMVTGGWNGREYLDTVEFLNLEFQEWEQLPSLLSARSDHSLAVVGGMAFVMGGFADGATNTTEVLGKDGWEFGASLELERYGQTSVSFKC